MRQYLICNLTFILITRMWLKEKYGCFIQIKLYKTLPIDLHFWHEIEAHLLEVRILLHDGQSHVIHLIVVEVELDPSRRGAHKVSSVL